MTPDKVYPFIRTLVSAMRRIATDACGSFSLGSAQALAVWLDKPPVKDNPTKQSGDRGPRSQ
jgi:hypothetical protein